MLEDHLQSQDLKEGVLLESHATFLIANHFVLISSRIICQSAGVMIEMFSADSSKAGPPAAVWHLAERAAFHIWIIHHLFDPPLKCHRNNGPELASVSSFLQPCGGKALTIVISSAVKMLKILWVSQQICFRVAHFSTCLWVVASKKKKLVSSLPA